MTEERDYNARIEIELMKKDLSIITNLYDKFDRALDKMQEIAHNLSQMVTLQTQRLENQEKLIRDFASLLEQRRSETASEFKEVNSRITLVNASLNDKIDVTEKKIFQELKQIKENLEIEIRTENRSFIERLREVELWKWAVTAVVAFAVWEISTAIDFIDLIKK